VIKKIPYLPCYTFLIAYFHRIITTFIALSLLSSHYHYFLLPAQNYFATVALTLQPYFYCTLNATNGKLGMVVKKKVMWQKSAASSVHYFCLWESVTAVPSLRLQSLSGVTKTNNFVANSTTSHYSSRRCCHHCACFLSLPLCSLFSSLCKLAFPRCYSRFIAIALLLVAVLAVCFSSSSLLSLLSNSHCSLSHLYFSLFSFDAIF